MTIEEEIKSIKKIMNNLKELKPKINSLSGKSLINELEEKLNFYSENVSKLEEEGKFDLVAEYTDFKVDRMDLGWESWDIEFPPLLGFRSHINSSNTDPPYWIYAYSTKGCYVKIDYREETLEVIPKKGSKGYPLKIEVNIWGRKEILDSISSSHLLVHEKIKLDAEDIVKLVKNSDKNMCLKFSELK